MRNKNLPQILNGKGTTTKLNETDILLYMRLHEPLERRKVAFILKEYKLHLLHSLQILLRKPMLQKKKKKKH